MKKEREYKELLNIKKNIEDEETMNITDSMDENKYQKPPVLHKQKLFRKLSMPTPLPIVHQKLMIPSEYLNLNKIQNESTTSKINLAHPNSSIMINNDNDSIVISTRLPSEVVDSILSNSQVMLEIPKRIIQVSF